MCLSEAVSRLCHSIFYQSELSKLLFFMDCSVKDRIAISMIEAAEREGIISPGKTTLVGIFEQMQPLVVVLPRRTALKIDIRSW